MVIQSKKSRARSEQRQMRELKIYQHYLSIIDQCESAQAAYEQIQEVNNRSKKNKHIAATSTIMRIVKRQQDLANARPEDESSATA